jgi:hypothetical protein
MLNLESWWIQGVGSSGFAANLVNDFDLVQFGSHFVLPCLETVRFDLVSSLLILLNLVAKER